MFPVSLFPKAAHDVSSTCLAPMPCSASETLEQPIPYIGADFELPAPAANPAANFVPPPPPPPPPPPNPPAAAHPVVNQ